MTSPQPDRHDTVDHAAEELLAFLDAEQAAAGRRLALLVERQAAATARRRHAARVFLGKP